MSLEVVSKKPLVGRLARTLILSSLFVLGGCAGIKNIMYKTTGDVMTSYAQDHQVPYVMATDDLGMNCGMAEALTPMLMSFSRVMDAPHGLAVMVYASAGMCAESRAWEEELRYLRALRSGNAAEAQDAQTAQKRYHVLAAQRDFRAYQHLIEGYGEPGGENCPELKTEFDSFIWMMGMIAGLQAMSNELAAGGGVGVPMNIAAKVERGASCLDDDQLWGMPLAIRATIWSMLPGAQPQGEDAFTRLKMAAAKGEQMGVRLPHVLYAMAAYNRGDMEQVKEIIRQHAAAKKKQPADPQRRLLDEIATSTLQAMSDRMWTEHTGHRTPVGGLGTFWDDRREPAGETIDLEGIL